MRSKKFIFNKSSGFSYVATVTIVDVAGKQIRTLSIDDQEPRMTDKDACDEIHIAFNSDDPNESQMIEMIDFISKNMENHYDKVKSSLYTGDKKYDENVDSIIDSLIEKGYLINK